MALLRRKRLIRFGTEKPTFIELPEGGILTQSRRSRRTVLDRTIIMTRTRPRVMALAFEAGLEVDQSWASTAAGLVRAWSAARTAVAA